MLYHEIDGPEDAPVLLMGGSLGCSLRMWDRQLPLSNRLRLIRFDHRGHGSSPVPPGPYEIEDLARDVLGLMDSLGLERASYCGLSLGGTVGMWIGGNAPERIDKLVLLCTAAYLPPAPLWQERAATVRAAGSLEPLVEPTLDRWLTPAFSEAHPEARAELREQLLATPAEVYASCCGAIERMDLRPMLGSIRSPTLVISGSDDPSSSPERQRELTEGIGGARHEVVGPAAHIAAVEQPEAVNRLIETHLL